MRALWLCGAAVFAVACSNFPTIETGVCGNRVIDPQEDCDWFADKASEMCRPPGSDGACHYDCTNSANGGPVCPAGWGCDGDSICRAPTTAFAPSFPLDVGAWNLTAGNFDGDARSDIMSSEPQDSIGATQIRFYYFDQNGDLEETRPFSKLIQAPMVKDVSGDKLSDVTFSFGQVSLMLGRKDRSWVPETFATYRLANSALRMVGVYTHPIQDASPIVPLIDFSDRTGFFIGGSDGQLDERAPVAGKVADLAGDPVSGNLFEDPLSSPCLEVVYALKRSPHFSVLNTCQKNDDKVVVWRAPFGSTDVPLVPAVAIDAAPQIVDMNHDGHLDVLVGAGGRPYVAYGDGQRLAPAVPYQLALANSDTGLLDIAMPLAAGDFSGDGAPDFVFPDRLLISGPTPNSLLPTYSDGLRNLLGAPYTSAIIADFNGNGFLDVIAGSNASLDLEFFNGNGTPDLTESRVATGNPVQFLAATDMDGDLITDLALFETAPAGESKSPLRIAFGSPFAPPGEPVTVANVAVPEQLVSYVQDSTGALVVASKDTVDGVSNGAFTFLDGSGDRVPYAALSLTEFSTTGSIDDSTAMAVAGGNFSSAGQADVLALAFSNSSVNKTGSSPTQPWLLPNILGAGPISERLPQDLDPSVAPIIFPNGNVMADITSAAADLNGDGRDEAIFAMSVGAHQEQCGVVMFSAARAGAKNVQPLEPIILNEPCVHPQLSAVDLDADQVLDLVLLTGETGGAARKLYVLWNDGAGGFSAAHATVASDAQDSPQAFAVLPSTAPDRLPLRPLSLAYVTDKSVRYASVIEKTRTFAAAVSVPGVDLFGGTGIAAADVNGDGVADLVVAESGKLIVLKAQLGAR